MAITRREFLTSAAVAAFAASGPYGLIDRFTRPVIRGPNDNRAASTAAKARSLPPEQHLFLGLSTVTDNATLVTVPPLHHAVITAKLEVPATTSNLKMAQQVLESAITGLEDSGLLDFRPSGLGLAVAWGLPYFNLLPTALTSDWLPLDLAASKANEETTYAVLNASRFASDPPGIVLEENDIAFVMASDHLDHIAAAYDAIFSGPPAELMTITSIRRGFVDGQKIGTNGQSLTKRMALEAQIPGAASIPDSAELFLGFTSTQQAALGPTVIANFETLPGVTNQWPNGYFMNGTTMHLSHIYEDLVTWYAATHRERAGFAFSPTVEATVGHGTQTLPEAPANVESLTHVEHQFRRFGFIGHSSSMQPASRLPAAITDNYGNMWPTGTATVQRADFNTLDSPFSFSATPKVDSISSNPAAGVHFVAFMPTSNLFNLMRQAMDGQYGSNVNLGFGAVHGPFNSVLRATHRQNFLVPPRSHRSFPLAELLT
jgi:hypothetical protein